MDVLLHIATAVAVIALMMGLRIVSNRAIFLFRMNNGFRAHECDGTCGRHGTERLTETEQNQRI